jgi:hypothetical protein
MPTDPATRPVWPLLRALTCGFLVELRGLEPLTPTLPVWCATSCAIAPEDVPIEATPRPARLQSRWSRWVRSTDMIELAGGVEFPQGQRLPAGDDLLGQQPTGRRALLHAPHAVPARDIDAVLAHLSYQRTPVGR